MNRYASRRARRSFAPFTRAVVAVAIGSLLVGTSVRAQDKSDDKLSKRAQRASEVLSELVSLPDRSPPKSLLNSATCIAVIPGVVQAGLGVGGRFGFGVASCRTPKGWSVPVFVGLKGGSFGFRGHRYEAILPEAGEITPFLRVALGARKGWSRDGVVTLLEEIARAPSIEALE